MSKLLQASALSSVCFTASILNRRAVKQSLQLESSLLDGYLNCQSEARGNNVYIFVGTGILVKVLGVCLLLKPCLQGDLSCRHGVLYLHEELRLWLALPCCILAKAVKCSSCSMYE